MFIGTSTALVTPFTSDGKGVDTQALTNLIKFQLDNGVRTLVFLGTTGEPATMSLEEKLQVIETACEIKKKNYYKIIVGIGSNCTNNCVDFFNKIKHFDIDGILAVTPYYNKATQEGIYQHYACIAKSINLPIICYNVPARTGVNMLPSTFKRLAKEFVNIRHMKEASGNMQQVGEYIKVANEVGGIILSGDDHINLPSIALGAKGTISVVSNVIPSGIVALTEACLNGKYEVARKLHFKYLDLTDNLFSEVNPIPVKKATQLMGLTNGVVRLPLTQLSAENEKSLTKVMKRFKLC